MNKKRFYQNRNFVAAVIILLLIFLSQFKLIQSLGAITADIIKPMAYLVFKTNVFIQRTSGQLTSSKSALFKENEKLQQEINSLLLQKSELERLKDENESLKKIVNFAENINYNYKVAQVIGRDPDENIEGVIINQGSDQGIVKNQIVLNEEGVVIGKINQVKNNTATVLFLLDHHSKLAVNVLNTNRTNGLLEGQFGLVVWMNYIPQDALINIGDLIVTNGSENNIPSGLLIGQIEEIQEQPDQLFKSAKVQQYVQYNQLNLVNVIIQSHD